MKIALHSVAGTVLAAGVVSFFVTLKLVGQEQQPTYAANVPLVFTKITRAPGVGESEGLSRGVRRSDGSWAHAWYNIIADGTPSEARLILDLQEGRHVLIDSYLGSVTTSYLTDNTIESHSRRPACDGEAVSNVLGYDVTRRVTPIVYPSGEQMRVEVLLAPELGCLEMERKTIAVGVDGTEHDIQVERVVDVHVGEPSQIWFNIPENYVEMSPEERIGFLHRVDDLSGDAFVQTLERNYREGRRAP